MRCIAPIWVRRSDSPQQVPCGKCNFCLETKRDDWTFRLLQEYKVAHNSFFLTFTYDDKHVLYGDGDMPTLCMSDFQLFVKRLRKSHTSLSSWPIRHYSVGEYGTVTARPHYHSIMFNVHESLIADLPRVWGKGNCFIGDVEVASIHYVTKYCINRVGDYSGREPPRAMMSKKPGIGANYVRTHFNWHRADMRNFTQVNGKIGRLPRYYKNKFFSDEERRELAIDSIAHLETSYIDTVDRLRAFHDDPYYYYDERIRASHDRITSKINAKVKF